MLTASICTIGDEILIGQVTDTNSGNIARALEEAGITYGETGSVTIVSFDAVRDAMQCCLEGKINVCVECNPLHGPRVAALIRQMEAGETPEKQNFVEEGLFTPDMLTAESVQAREY